ncbi:MAG: hypothetical protein M1820_003269 [Bogoriella megaspora]|nr:MAG: hypothetical protein M1820_003269 [Bogoriella megaspora]
MSDAVGYAEAPVTVKAYLMCAFAAFGGIMFGYDSGYISGVLGMDFFKREFGKPVSTDVDPSGYLYTTPQKSLIVSILSAGTFFGALLGGEMSDWFGRRITVIIGCIVYMVGIVLQVASTTVPVLVVGRVIGGFGVGIVSTNIILYMSEIAPKNVRGAIVSGYQFSVTIGLLLASCVAQGTHNGTTSASYRIPVGLQFLWGLILGGGIVFLPESPRWFVMKDRQDDAAKALARLRSQPIGSTFIADELTELVANREYELRIAQPGWLPCLKGGWKPSGNLRRCVLGILTQMMQQWTGVNFIFYYGTTFFQSSGIKNAFIISVITNVVNVAATPVSFYTIEKFGRRTLLIYGAVAMVFCEFIIAIVGTADKGSQAANICLIVFVCIYIFFFAMTWGPGAWVLISEIFPLPIRAKGVALATASNWFWNCIIGVITPYMVDSDEGNLGSKVFFVWGSLCCVCVLFSYFLVPETKGLSLEQVDKMLEETTPRTSAGWKPHDTFAHEMGMEKATHLSEVAKNEDA